MGPAAPSVGRTSKSRLILGQKIALISALVLLGRSRCRVLLRPALLVLGSFAGRFPPADKPVRPCLATQMLGWPPLRPARSFAAQGQPPLLGHCCARSPRQVYLALRSLAASWPAFALASLEHLLPWSLAGRPMWSRPLSLYRLLVAVFAPVRTRVVSRPAAVTASEF